MPFTKLSEARRDRPVGRHSFVGVTEARRDGPTIMHHSWVGVAEARRDGPAVKTRIIWNIDNSASINISSME